MRSLLINWDRSKCTCLCGESWFDFYHDFWSSILLSSSKAGQIKICFARSFIDLFLGLTLARSIVWVNP
jgi:hypothetical protein